MKTAIAGVVVLLDMFLIQTASVAGLLHEPTGSGCFPLRSCGTFAHARCVMTSVTAGVGGGGLLALWLGFEKSDKKRQYIPSSITMQTFFNGNTDKKIYIYKN